MIVGCSAGAYLLASYYFSNSARGVLEGYGCVPVRVVCHYQSEFHVTAEDIDPVEEINKFDNTLELILLKDFEWKVFEV